MSPPFTHLHVASGYSMRYGASTPVDLVAAAASRGMDAVALTDRDGAYGAVKFIQACETAKLTPLLGVDLAVQSGGAVTGLPGWADPGVPRPRRAPARGGASVDPRHPRVTVLALAGDAATGLPAGAGWGRVCRLISATHLRGERGTPVSSLELIAEHAVHPGSGLPALAVLLGPDSELGRALLTRRLDLATTVLRRWQAALPPGALVVEVVCHRGPPGTPASLAHAARMLGFARRSGVPVVLSNAVRHADPDGAPVVDLLDAARRLVALDTRHVDRTTAQGYLAGPGEMAALATEIAAAAGEQSWAGELLAGTEALARRCRLDPVEDVGIGKVMFPEPVALGLPDSTDLDAELRRNCFERIGTVYPRASNERLESVRQRLEIELGYIRTLGYAAYFLTVSKVCTLIHDLGVRVAARGSGAGSLVNHLLGISGVDPIEHRLVMERFLSPMRLQMPDIDVDVESARRTEVYEEILRRFGAERVTCVSMMDTYRVRHAIRDAGAALGLPVGEIDAIAKSFPHIRARDVRHAIAELPELRASGLAASRLDLLFDLVERLDGLPRHVALHPCGVVLSGAGLLERTPVEASWQGFPMSQFDKDDVETVGLLKLDVLGIRMQSAMAYALDEIVRVDGPAAAAAGEHPDGAGYLAPDGRIDLDAVPHDDETTYRMIRSTRTLGCFQIESPGQRELVGKFGPRSFNDLIIDISLFRPGPVKSDMITPFLRARNGWDAPQYLHSSLREVLEETCGVVVFHEQILQMIAITARCSIAQADEVRRALGNPALHEEVEQWWRPRVTARGYDTDAADRIWEVLKAFASFGFCKAHAAAFALPTYHSAWLKAHHPAAFLAGVLTHDPGMYPKRLILDDARNLGISVLPLDINASDASYRVERMPDPGAEPECRPAPGRGTGPEDDIYIPDGRAYGIRIALADVKGISDAEVARIVAGRPYHSLPDLWHRAQVSRPVVERLVLAGAFDSLYGLSTLPVRRRDRVSRRDLLLQVGELDRWTRATRTGLGAAVGAAAGDTAGISSVGTGSVGTGSVGTGSVDTVRAAAARQSQAPRAVAPVAQHTVQLLLDLGDAPDRTRPSGLPEMTGAERVRTELEVLGLDTSRHVIEFYVPLLDALGVTRASQVLSRRSRSELLVAGVKVATQTPPVRSGRRVVFLTLDDATGPVDATFFEDVQGPYAATVFHSWLLVVRGELRRTGRRGVSLRATGAWELPVLWDAWVAGGPAAAHRLMAAPARLEDVHRSARRGPANLPAAQFDGGMVVPGHPDTEPDHEAAAGLPTGDRSATARAGGMGGGEQHRRVLVHPSGFRQSPYADIKQAGENPRDTRRMIAAGGDPTAGDDLDPTGGDPLDTAAQRERRRQPPRKLWHASPGSSGR